MRAYADEIIAHAAGLEESDAQAAREWADWIRQHEENTDPLNGPLRLEDVASCSHEELLAVYAWLEHPWVVPALGAAPFG